MKNNTLLAVFLFLTATTVFAQEDFNKWSIDFGAGVNKATEPYSLGFDQNQMSDLALEVGARYMFNDRFGLRADFGYADIQPSSGSFDFESEFMRFGVQGVANLGSIMNFRDWTNRFNLLGHAGVSYGRNKTQFVSETDQFIGITGGLTPQFKITDRFALNLNITAMAFDSADLTWDGASDGTRRGFDHKMFTTTLGLSVYLGDNEQHADFVDNSKVKQLEKEVEEIEGRLAKLESDLQDDDRDGVPNYIDTEPNTPTGIRVDSKGRAIDVNKNGIPDDMESALNKTFLTQETAEESGMMGDNANQLAKTLLNEGYVNVYFKFDSTQPEIYSFDAVNYMVTYMRNNPDATAKLTGYADQVGNTEYNNTLSERRAKKVYDILVNAGIDEGRLEYQGGGVDESVDANAKEARNIVRRVTFELN
ncbi:OmpA family protein [Psychroflexus planctonicus]|uniref:OmpA-like domain-containing protein n=1 Tax=Psychroflexus planctonicus TaxID=1526575 RepID=A0ABQ1SLH2_9FLAO|nr:OmpA family protein [Psychroflexus planctonicus]GGE42013.1 hypothetical protein GCM10010832_22540 [Psychroflexus planctonicus]